jgi:hypothetical protein
MKNKLLQKPFTPTGLSLEAVLLNSDMRSTIPLEAIKPDAICRYQTFIAAGEATIHLPSGEYRLAIDFKDGNALLHLYSELMPMSIAGVATSAIGASELWQFLVDLHTGTTNQPEPEPPRALPWLGLNLLPEFVAAADHRMIRQFSALHWLLGWAVIEYAQTQQRRN